MFEGGQVFRDVLAAWLAANRGVDLSAGLSREEAIARARVLRERILAGTVRPGELDLDEEAKDVLYAMVELLRVGPGGDPALTLDESNAVFQFIRLVDWPGDELQEKQDLLRACAEVGWSSRRLDTFEILRSPNRWRPAKVSREEAAEAAAGFLEKLPGERSSEETERCLTDADVPSSIFKLLRDALNTDPRRVAAQASSVYGRLRALQGTCGLFDEHEYFLGEAALIAAGALRLLGGREETESWLQHAEAGFRHTVNPEPLLTQVAYVRLALQYDKGRYREVLELLPSTLKSFEKFGMEREAAKTRFLEAMALKACSRNPEAFEKFVALTDTLDEREDAGLLGQVFGEIGAYQASEGRFEDAIGSYRRGLVSLGKADRPYAVAALRITVGETLRMQGALSSAIEAYREGIQTYAAVGMSTYVAYSRLILADALIALGRHREAEWEILAALPTIEKQKMVPEGFAAVALLRESVRRRQTDPNALRELHEGLRQADALRLHASASASASGGGRGDRPVGSRPPRRDPPRTSAHRDSASGSRGLETFKTFRFPNNRQPLGLSAEEAAEAASAFLEMAPADRPSEEAERCLSDPDLLSSLCRLLRDTLNSNPRLVAERASFAYRGLRANEGKGGLFDGEAYFSGETALLAASAFRLLGDRQETETWLHRAEAGFRHTVNPEPLLAQATYVRLALLYDRRRHQDVLDLLPSTLESFEKFGMRNELAKTRYLEAMTLKDCSRRTEAFEKLAALRDTLNQEEDPGLLGQVGVEIGACLAWKGRYEEAVASYRAAMPLLSKANRLFAVADLKITVGETLQLQGLLPAAVEAFREGIAGYAELGISAQAAYARIVLAETLISLGRHREAEWEILAALPTIDEQKMVPEGFAAVALLRESVRRRETDSNALRELREHLRQANS